VVVALLWLAFVAVQQSLLEEAGRCVRTVAVGLFGEEEGLNKFRHGSLDLTFRRYLNDNATVAEDWASTE